MCPIAWDGGPAVPPPRPPCPPILNVAGKSFIRALGDAVGVFVHWSLSRTVP